MAPPRNFRLDDAVKANAFSRDCTLDFEFGSFPGPVIRGTIFSHDAGQGPRPQAASRSRRSITDILTTIPVFWFVCFHSVFTFGTVFNVSYGIFDTLLENRLCVR